MCKVFPFLVDKGPYSFGNFAPRAGTTLDSLPDIVPATSITAKRLQLHGIEPSPAMDWVRQIVTDVTTMKGICWEESPSPTRPGTCAVRRKGSRGPWCPARSSRKWRGCRPKGGTGTSFLTAPLPLNDLRSELGSSLVHMPEQYQLDVIQSLKGAGTLREDLGRLLPLMNAFRKRLERAEKDEYGGCSRR